MPVPVIVRCPHCGKKLAIGQVDPWTTVKDKVYLWYSDSTCETGRALTAALGVDSGTEQPNSTYKNIICWGSRRPNGWRESDNVKYINKPSSIVANRNKFEAIKKFISNGVRAPEVFNADNISNINNFPVIGRRISHQGGSDAVVCLDQRSANRAKNRGSQYFVKYIPKSKEYRIHIFKGEFFMGSKKIAPPDDNTNGIGEYIWSSNYGWTFSNSNPDNITDDIKDLSIKAVATVGLDFGAVDIILGEDNLPYVLEVNTGPSLIPRRTNLYRDKFKDLIISNSNIE